MNNQTREAITRYIAFATSRKQFEDAEKSLDDYSESRAYDKVDQAEFDHFVTQYMRINKLI